MIHILNQDDEIIDYFDINDGTVLEPNLIRNIENLEDTLEFSVATNRSINVQDRNRVIIQDNEGVYREFIIMQYESNLDGFTDVSCVGSHLEDFQTSKPYKPQKLERYTTKEALSFMAADTGWEVAPDSEWNGLRTTSWSSWKDRLSLLKQLQTTYDMRLSFYVELGTNTVKHRYVKLVEVNPMFNGEEIVYGENMIDLKRTVDFTDVATALIAIGPEDNDGNRLIIEEVDNEAQSQLGLPYRYLWQIYEPESDDQGMTEARLRTLARTKLNKIKSASVEYTIQSTQLNVKNGDMIRVKNEDFTPELYVEAEVIEIRYNAYTKLCDYKFGILTEYTRAEVYERFNALLATLRERLNNIRYDTENVINERLEEELAGLERYIEKSPFPPLDPQEGDLWLDTSHDQVAVLKRYENGEWVKSSVTEAHEVNAPTKEEALYTMLQERKNRLNNDFISNYGLFNTLTTHKHYDELDAGIKNTLYNLFVDQTNKYSAFEADFDYINEEQPTIGLILAAMESALRFEDSSNKFKTGYNTTRAALDAYLEILRSQYTEQKYLDALNEVADKFGLDVVDGKLLGDANFIENMEEIKIELQQQLDAAKKAFDELEIGGRNLMLGTSFEEKHDDYSYQRLDVEYLDGTLIATNQISELTTYPRILYRPLRNLIAGEKYTISFKAKGDIDFSASFWIADASGANRQLGSQLISYSEEWKTYTFTFTVNENFSDATTVQWWVNATNPDTIQTLFLKEVKLEKGTVATDWTPAPEDTDNKITNINQSITNIEGQLQSTVNQQTFDLLKGTVTQQGTTIQQTADSLSSKADKSVVDTLSGTVNNHGTKLTQTAEELASKADKTSLDAANNKITQQGTLISQNAQEIALRAKTSDLNSVTGRVSKAEADIKINAGEISSRVKNVDYQTDKDGIISRLSGAESSITQQSNLIASKVSSTELTQAIDNIEIGGRNLILNSDWNITNSNYLMNHIYTSEELIIGEIYTLTIRGRLGEDRSFFRFYTNSGYSHFLKPDGTTGGGIFEEVSDGVYRTTLRYSNHATSTHSHNHFRLYQQTSTDTSESYVSTIQLEKGNKATDWTPAPEDTEVGGRNLLLDSDKYNSFNGSGSPIFEMLDEYKGKRNVLKVTNPGGYIIFNPAEKYSMPYEVGQQYNVSFSAMHEGLEPTNKPTIYMSGASGGYREFNNTMNNVSFTRINRTFTPSAQSTNRIHMNFSGYEVVYIVMDFMIVRGNTPMDWTPAPEDADAKIKANENRIISHDTKFEQTDTQLSLKATMTDVNQSDKTLSQAISELVIDSTNGLKFNYDSNGRLASYSVGRDGIQFDGSKIVFKASDSIMLQIADAKKAGTDAKTQADAARNGNNIAASLNLSGTTTKISGSKIELVGDVDMVNGNTRIKNLDLNRATATGNSNNSKLLITGDMVEQRGKFNRRYHGVSYEYDVITTLKGGYLRFGDENRNRALNISAFGISTFLDGDGEWADAPGSSGYIQWWDGTYSPSNANGITVGSHNVVALKSDNNRIVLEAEMSVRLESKASPIHLYPYSRDRPGLNRFNFTVSEATSATLVHGYIMWGAGDEGYPYNAGLRFHKNESRVAVVGSNFATGGSTTLEAGTVEVNNVMRRGDGWYAYWNGRSSGTIDDASFNSSTQLIATSMVTMRGDTNMYLGTRGGGELRVTNEKGFNSGKGITYRDVAMATLNTHRSSAFSNHSGANVYFGVGNNGLRITNNNHFNDGNIAWRDIEFRNWKANSHEKYKKDIKEWDINVLDIFRNELQLYQYKYKDNLENNMLHRGIVLREDSTHDKFPAEWRQDDGFNGNEVMWWNTKAIQELAQDNYNKDEIMKEQGAKIAELEKQMSEVMQLLKNK